jgi:hypothetical protein
VRDASDLILMRPAVFLASATINYNAGQTWLLVVRRLCGCIGLVGFLKHARFRREHNVFLRQSLTWNLNNLAILQDRIVVAPSAVMCRSPNVQ